MTFLVKFRSLIGWYGVVAILGAYALVSFSIVDVHGWLYQVLNLTGALGLVLVSYHKKDYQPAVLNAIWAIVALVAAIRLFFRS